MGEPTNTTITHWKSAREMVMIRPCCWWANWAASRADWLELVRLVTAAGGGARLRLSTETWTELERRTTTTTTTLTPSGSVHAVLHTLITFDFDWTAIWLLIKGH